MQFPKIISCAAVVFVLSLSALADAQFTSKSLTAKIYSDGSAAIAQVVSANSNSPQITVHLLSSILSNMIVLDQNEDPLSYQISGENITIYTLGATTVTLHYDTLNLTSKQGTVWMLVFPTPYNSTIVLPFQATLSYISGTPASVSNQNGFDIITIPPGDWKISYGVPFRIVTTSSSASTATVGNPSLPYLEPLLIGAVAIVSVLGVFVYLRRRRTETGIQPSELRPDDIQVLNYISEKGGKVLEAEIRTRFILPKTTGWRQIKRLERMGYVKITKIGATNQIELLRKPEGQ
jgi:uncharacterized membrane protein